MKNDVFLNFRGKDTREKLIVPLYRALCAREIKAYFDDYGLPRGEEISQSLIEAIKNSRMSVVVLSPNYASSYWCLDELVQILECKKTNGQLVYPVFCGIEPSEVENLNDGCYREALAQHEERFKNNMVKVKRWKLALFDVAQLPGSQIKNGCEAEFIKGIVEEISQKLNGGPSRRVSGQPEPDRSNNGSRDDLQMLAGRTGFGERGARRINFFLDFPQEAHTKLLGTSSCQKKSRLQQNEEFMTPYYDASSSKYGENFQHYGELSTNEISILNEKQIWAEIRFAQLFESRANQGSASTQFEGGLSSLELNGNDSGSNLNVTSMEGLLVSHGGETTNLSDVEDAGNVSTEGDKRSTEDE